MASEEEDDEDQEEYEDFLMMIAMVLEDMDDEDMVARNNDWIRQRLDWESHVRKLVHEGLFERKYSMSLGAFEELVETLRPYIKHNGRKRNKSISPITTEVMVSATIRMLAGGSYLDIYETHVMNVEWTYKVRDKVINAILACNELKIEFPSEPEDIDNIRVGFMQASANNVLHKCLGVKDGLLQ